MKLLIQNGRVVDPVNGTVSILDLYVENGKVLQLEKDIQTEADRVIDATGLVVCPGLVDLHVHLRDPGLTYKEDIFTGTAAAARGGVTAMACMANTDPVVDSPEQIQYIREKAGQANGVHVYPVGAVSRGLRGEELTDADALKKAGAAALSDDGCNVDNANLMRDALIHAKRVELPILCHCEDTSMVGNRAVNEGSVSRQLWMEGRPAIAEEIVVMRDAMLAEETGAHVHICHVSTAKSVDIIRRMKKRGVALTCETCPQYFTLTEDEILTRGALARVNPPLRTAKDIKGIIAGLKDGTIDAIATDHAPHSAEEKTRPLTDAPSGMVGLETSLALSLTVLHHQLGWPLMKVLRAMSTAPAGILQLDAGSLRVGAPADIVLFDPEETWTVRPEAFASKGRLAIGSDSDVVIFDPDEAWTVDPNRFASKGRNTPFAGKTLRGKVKYTIVGGEIVYWEGE